MGSASQEFCDVAARYRFQARIVFVKHDMNVKPTVPSVPGKVNDVVRGRGGFQTRPYEGDKGSSQ